MNNGQYDEEEQWGSRLMVGGTTFGVSTVNGKSSYYIKTKHEEIHLTHDQMEEVIEAMHTFGLVEYGKDTS